MSKDDKGIRPSAVVGQDGLVVVPELAPEHTLSGTRNIAGGLIGMAEQAIAVQAGAFDMAMAKENVAKLAEFQEFLKALAFSKLKPSDFVAYSSISGDQEDEGKPWLTVNAAERVAETCGIAYGFLTPAMEEDSGTDADGEWYTRRCRMWFKCGSRYVEAIGEAESRDGLFSKGGKLSASKAPRAKIGQKAISRATQIGIGKILGLRNLTWERVRELMGDKAPDPKNVSSAKFNKGAKGGGIQSGKDEDKATAGQFGSFYQRWCEAEGRSNDRDAFKANADAFMAFVNGVLEDPPDTRMRKWSDYKLGEVRQLMKAADDLAAQEGHHDRRQQ